MEPRLAVGLLALAALNVPASADTTDATNTTEITSPTSDSETGDDPTAASTLVVDGLAQLPPRLLETWPIAYVADLDAATEADGLTRPTDPADTAAVEEWITGLSGFAGVDEPPLNVAVALPASLTQDPEPAELADGAGWSIVDVATLAWGGALPDEFAVVGAGFADEALSPDLIEVTDGVVTDREGEDGAQDLDDPSGLDDLGRPIRFAVAGGRIAMGSSTPEVEAWLNGTAETLADDPSMLAVGAALDDASVVSAAVFRPSDDDLGAAEPDQLAEELAGIALDQPYDALGLGWSVDDDGAAAITLAYHFASADIATESAERLERIFTDGTTIGRGTPISDSFELRDVTATDEVAVVTVRPSDDAEPDAYIVRWLIQGELPFVVLPG